MTNRGWIIGGLTLLLIIVGLVLIFDTGDDVDIDVDVPTPTSTDGALDEDSGDGQPSDTDSDEEDAPGIPATGYSAYFNTDLGFSILRPSASTVSEEGEGRIKFTFLGPDNTLQSEITDGFTLTVAREGVTATTTLLAFARSERDETLAPGATLLSALEERMVNSMAAYRFSYRNMLGSRSTSYIFLPTTGTGYVATYTVSDPENRGYQTMVFNMLESISFSS